MYKIRVVLDTEEDVIRTILIDNEIHLETLHQTIANSFGFKGTEMASFYLSDEEWNEGEEIPLFNMSEAGEGASMATTFLKDVLGFVGSKMIYVYDFLKMWTFYVEVLEISEETEKELPLTILSLGEVPAKAPEKSFTAENEDSLDFDEDFNNEFESLDDIDFDQY